MPDPAALSAAAQRTQQQLEAVGALQALVQGAAREQPHGGSRSCGAGSGGEQLGGAALAAAQPEAAVDAAAHSSASGPAHAGGTALLAIPSLPVAAGGGEFGTTALLHFAYKLNGRQQYVMSPFSSVLQQAGLQQVRANHWLAVLWAPWASFPFSLLGCASPSPQSFCACPERMQV